MDDYVAHYGLRLREDASPYLRIHTHKLTHPHAESFRV